MRRVREKLGTSFMDSLDGFSLWAGRNMCEENDIIISPANTVNTRPRNEDDLDLGPSNNDENENDRSLEGGDLIEDVSDKELMEAYKETLEMMKVEEVRMRLKLIHITPANKRKASSTILEDTKRPKLQKHIKWISKMQPDSSNTGGTSSTDGLRLRCGNQD